MIARAGKSPATNNAASAAPSEPALDGVVLVGTFGLIADAPQGLPAANAQQQAGQEPLLNTRAVATLLDSCPKTIRNLVIKGHLQPVPLPGRSVKFNPRDIRDYIENGPRPKAAAAAAKE
jgi:hypothetical protein